MERPTTKQIDQWLAGIASRTPMHSPESEEMVIGLAAEVRALQAELSETQAHLRSALDAGEAAERRVVELRKELEVERMRLAACGVAAHGAGDEHFANMLPEYDSDALRATRALREELETARSAATKLIDRLMRTDPFGGAGV
jgi:hypothetical protein